MKKANEKAEEREKQLTALKEEVEKLRKEVDTLRQEAEKLREEEEESRTEAEKRQKDVEKLQAEADKLRQEAAKVRNKSNLLAKHDVADARPQSKQALADAEKAKDSVQSELDDLLMVFGDLEEKLSKYKVGDFILYATETSARGMC